MSSKVSLKIEGLNLHHIIEFIEKNNLKAENLERPDRKTLLLTLSLANFKKLKKFSRISEYKLKIIKTGGAINLCSRLIYRIGLVIGIVAVTLSTFFITNKVYVVELNTSGHVCENNESCIFTEKNRERLEKKLGELGIYRGATIKNIAAPRLIEAELVEAFDQISAVSVRIKGVKVYIDILEAKLDVNETSSALLSPMNAIVVKTDVSSGKLLVKNGDIVLKSQPLVETEDGVPVSATIVLRAFFNDSVLYNEDVVTYVRTGKTQQFRSLSFSKGSAGPSELCDFSLYEAEERQTYVFYNLFVPLISKTTTYYELERREEKVEFEKVEAELKANLEASIVKKLPASAEKIKSSFAIYREKNRVRLDCYVETLLTLKKGRT